MRKIAKAITIMMCLSLFAGCSEVENGTPVTSKVAETSSESSSDNSTPLEEITDVDEPTPEPVKNGKIDLKTEEFEIKYIKHKITKDYEGNPCLLYFYSFKNLSDKAVQPTVATQIKCFQDGVQCESTSPKDDLKESMNDFKEIKKGGKINCYACFAIERGKEATIEATKFLYDDIKAVQTIKIK